MNLISFFVVILLVWKKITVNRGVEEYLGFF